MAKKKKGGTRTVSRKEREERLKKPEEPFGPKRYLKDKGVNILLSAVILAVLCAACLASGLLSVNASATEELQISI